MALPSLTFAGKLKDLPGLVVSGALAETALTQAKIRYRSNIPEDAWVIYGGIAYRVAAEVLARVDTEGNIVNEDGGPVLLLANDPALNVRGIQWRMSVEIPTQIIPPALSGGLRTFWFNATAAGTTIQLASVVPAIRTDVGGTSGGSGLDQTGIVVLVTTDGTPLREALDDLYGGSGGPGGGVSSWDDLEDIPAALAIGPNAAGGYAVLDVGGKLPGDVLPNLALIQYKGSKSSQAQMLSTTGEQGDWITRTDDPATWVITGSTPSQLSSWTRLPFPTVDLSGKVDKTSTPKQMYGTDASGNQITGTYDDAATPNSLVLRDAGARVAVGDGTANGHAVNKLQMDTADAILKTLSTQAEAYVAFSTQSNGDPKATLDTGQPVTFALTDGSGWKPQISSGKLVRGALPASGNYADYYQAQLDGDISVFGTRWTVNSADGSTNGTMCLAVWERIWEGAGNVVPKTPAHITIDTLNGTWAWWVSDGGGTGSTHLKAVKTGTFTPPASNGSAVWECAAYIDAENGIAYLMLPGNDVATGSRYVTITDAELASLLTAQGVPVTTFAATLAGADVLMVEHFATTAANTAIFPRYLDMWGETKKVTRDTKRNVLNRSLFAPLLDFVATATKTFTNKTLTNPRINSIMDTNGATALNISATTSAATWVQLVSAISGGAASVRAAGTDPDVNLNLRGKGTGRVTIGSAAELVATEPYVDAAKAQADTVVETATGKVIRSTVILTPTAANDSFGFPARVRPYDPTRRRCVIRNIGAASFVVGYGTGNSSDLNSPGGAAFIAAQTVPVGSEWVDTSERPMFIRPVSVSTDLVARVDTELGVV